MTENAAVDPAVDLAPDSSQVVFDLTVLDTREPRRLADFYAAVLGWTIARVEDDWVTLRPPSGGAPALAFQLAEDFVPPTWPLNDVPQQVHLDFNVVNIEAAEHRVIGLGAQATGLPDTALHPTANFRAYRDPSGHLFCLCW